MSIITLDEIQRKLVYHPLNHSFLIISPPGFGKTTIMAKRIQYLIENKKINPPYKILGLTFSNAAANEMIKKIKEEIDDIRRKVDIFNFHAFGYKLLRQYGNMIGLNRKFDIMSDDEDRHELKSFLRNKLINPEDLNQIYDKRYNDWKRENILKLDTNYHDLMYDDIFREYQNYLENFQKKKKCITFDHILKMTIQIFEKYPQVLEHYRSKYKYILVDEFQDTNNLQYKILKLLANGLDSIQPRLKKIDIFILIDPFQAIYLFQGADPKGFNKLIEDFNCQSEELVNNYRTESEVLKALCNSYRTCKEFESKFISQHSYKKLQIPKEKINLMICKDGTSEAEYILNKIKELIEKDIPLEEICIIARTQYYRLNSIKSILEKNNIDYIFLPDFMTKNLNNQFKTLFKKLSEISENNDKKDSLYKFVRNNIKIFNYYDNIVFETLLEFSKKIDRLNRQKKLKEKIQIFRNDLFLQINWSEIYKKKIKDKIFISSVHQIKGLEFDYLFFCGLENYTIPTWHTCPYSGECKRPELFEEKNIFYVGITRPRRGLFLSSIRLNYNNKERRVSCLIKKIEQFIEFQFKDFIISEDAIYCRHV